MLVSAAPASASAGISGSRADQIAIRVLQPQRQGGPVNLYRLPRPISAHSTVDQAGTPSGRVVSARFQGRQGARFVRTPLTRRAIDHRSWLYWEDLAPGTLFTHPSVLLLVDARTGRVRRRAKLEWAPLVNGKVPSFATAGGSASRIYTRASATTAAPLWRVPARIRAAAADGSCIVASGDFGEALTGPNFRALRSFADSLGPNRYYEGRDFAGIKKAIDTAYANGCRDLVLYLNGNQGTGKLDDFKRWLQGLPSGPYVSLKSIRIAKFVWKTDILTAQDLRGILLGERDLHPDLDVSLVVEACHSGDFPAAVNPAGAPRAVDQVLTSVGPDQFSIGPADSAGATPSPFLGTLLDAVGKYLGGNGGPGLGAAIRATAPQVQQQVEAVGGQLYDGKWPQTPQFESETVSGQVLPGSGGCTPNDAARGACKVPDGKVLVRVGLILEAASPSSSDAIQISPPGRTVTRQDPLPSYGNPAVGDLYFFADPGASVTLMATPAAGDYFDGWANTTGGTVCGNQPGDHSIERSCSVHVTARGAPSDPLFGVSAAGVFLKCPPPGTLYGRPGAVRDCPGVSP